jgi:hypothetical protein
MAGLADMAGFSASRVAGATPTDETAGSGHEAAADATNLWPKTPARRPSPPPKPIIRADLPNRERLLERHD